MLTPRLRRRRAAVNMAAVDTTEFLLFALGQFRQALGQTRAAHILIGGCVSFCGRGFISPAEQRKALTLRFPKALQLELENLNAEVVSWFLNSRCNSSTRNLILEGQV